MDHHPIRRLTAGALVAATLLVLPSAGAVQYVAGPTISVDRPVRVAGETLDIYADCGDLDPPTTIRLLTHPGLVEIATGTVDLAAATATLVIPADTPAGHYRVELACTSTPGAYERVALRIEVVAAPTTSTGSAPTVATPTYTG